MGESRSVYFQDDDLWDSVEDAVDAGEYRNLSHAIEDTVAAEFSED